MSETPTGDVDLTTGSRVMTVAEMSANHGKDYERAVDIVHAAAEAGADAIKVQTFTPDTLTIACDNEHFRIDDSTLWAGRNLHELYAEAAMPWDWQPKLKNLAEGLGLIFFSTAYDASSLEFLEEMEVPFHKIASFELADLALIRTAAATGKPLVLSTGMATLAEIENAVNAAREAGAGQVVLLKCVSCYPARAEDMNLRTIPHMREAFEAPAGISDHTFGSTVPVAAVSLGACMVEKHFTLSRTLPGPDSAFSMEPAEFHDMVQAVRTAEKALGRVHYGPTAHESASRVFRRSLFVVQDVAAGERFTEDNLRCIRPGNGLAPTELPKVLGLTAARDVPRGTPLSWEVIGPPEESGSEVST